MPRKTIARRKPVLEVPIEHRTKARHDAPRHPSSPPPIETLVPHTIPSNPCTNKQITPRRKLSFEFLRVEGFSIGDNLKNMYFETLYNLDILIYPNLVKEFYGALSRGFSGFTSTIRGISMHITYLLLGRIIHLSTEGVEIIIHAEREVTLRLVLGRDDVG